MSTSSSPDFGKLEESPFTTPYASMTKEDINKYYSSSCWSHRMSPDDVINSHIDVLTRGSQEAKRSIECSLNVPYGDCEDEKLDIFSPSSLPKGAPIFVYLHGGYWHLLGREMSSFMASSFVSSGAGVVVLGYGLGRKITMDKRVDQIKRGMKHILDIALARGSSGVLVGGHSAGGHLTAMMMSVDWKEAAPQSHHLLKGFIPVSGIFDVRPFIYVDDNEDVGLDLESAWRNSPARLTDLAVKHNKQVKVLVAMGEHDSPELRRQSKEYFEALNSKGMNVKMIDAPNTDHFNVVELLGKSSFILSQEIFNMMTNI